MTEEQVKRIITAICDEHDGDDDDNRPNIEIMHGYGQYTVIDAVFPAWGISDGILQANTTGGTRWIACESINSIGI